MFLFHSLLFCFLNGISFSVTYGKPNIIILVADDLGWNDLSFHGSSQIPTPHLDALAKEGVILNNYYVCPVCSPSRGALMTGMYPIHTGLQCGPIHASSPYGLPLRFNLMPSVLKSMGYKTYAVGKWHLGFFKKKYTPTFRGFNSHFGYWAGKEDYFDHTQELSGMWGLDFHHNMNPVTNALGNYSTSLFTEHAVKTIKEHNSSQPLFLYVAYQSVHSANSYSPLQAPTEYIERFEHIKNGKRRTFAAMVSAMDDSVGTIISALRSSGLLKNSVVVMTTDNGGPAAGFNDNAASNWPLRGVKATLWEGGVRGVSLLYSPLVKRRGRISMELMHITDWLPTIYSVAGGDLAALGPIDGINMWETLSNDKPSPRKEVLLNIDPVHKNAALRVGSYKVIKGLQYDGLWDGWYGPSGRKNDSIVLPKLNEELQCNAQPLIECVPQKKPCLFNVEKDPCEYHNIADDQPQVLSKLLDRLEVYEKSMVEPGNKPADPRSDPKYHGYQWVNWMD